MSADQFGASLLAEVHEESLKEILFDLRYTLNPLPKAILGVPALDKILEEIRYPPDAGPSYMSFADTQIDHNQNQESDDHEYHLGTTSPTHGTKVMKLKPIILNINSNPSRDQGETSLLYYLTALSIVPHAQGGKDGIVVWLDTCHRLSAIHLYQITVAYLRRRAPNLSAPLASTIAKDSLKHVHVLSIPSTKKLISTLDELPSYLHQSSGNGGSSFQHLSNHRPLSLLVLDSATQFYWQDRFDAEIARLQASAALPSVSESHRPTEHTTPRQRVKLPVSSTMQILDRLRSVQSRFDCVVAYTSNPIFTFVSPANKTRAFTANSATPQPGPPPGENLSTDIFTFSALLTLNISRLEVPQFAPQMSLEACLKDRSKRQEVVSQGAFKVTVIAGAGTPRTVGSRTRRDQEFVMKISERDGVIIEEN